MATTAARSPVILKIPALVRWQKDNPALFPSRFQQAMSIHAELALQTEQTFAVPLRSAKVFMRRWFSRTSVRGLLGDDDSGRFDLRQMLNARIDLCRSARVRPFRRIAEN